MSLLNARGPFQPKLCYDSVKILCRVRSAMVTANLGDNETVDKISLPCLTFIKIRHPCLCWISSVHTVEVEKKVPLETESSNPKIGFV